MGQAGACASLLGTPRWVIPSSGQWGATTGIEMGAASRPDEWGPSLSRYTDGSPKGRWKPRTEEGC
jgi:hypothetical protein